MVCNRVLRNKTCFTLGGVLCAQFWRIKLWIDCQLDWICSICFWSTHQTFHKQISTTHKQISTTYIMSQDQHVCLTPALSWKEVPIRACRLAHAPNYVSPSIPDLLELDKNPHYHHRFCQRGTRWPIMNILSANTIQIYQNKINGVIFNYQTASWYLWSGINDRALHYIEYGNVSTRLQKASWKYMKNQVVAVSRLFIIEDEEEKKHHEDWYFRLLKVKSQIDKYDSDEHMLEQKCVALNDLHPFNAAAYLLHHLHLRVWNELNPDLQEYLSHKIRFSNEELVCN